MKGLQLDLFISPQQCQQAIDLLAVHAVELEEKAKDPEKDILELLDRNPRAVERAIVAIYNLQTAEEQNDKATHASNGVGFNARDASYGSWLAGIVNKGGNLYGKALDHARNMAKRYRRQLVELASTSY